MDTGSLLSSSGNGFTIEKVLEEKKEFDLSLSLEKASLVDVDKGWLVPGRFVSLISFLTLHYVRRCFLASDGPKSTSSAIFLGRILSNVMARPRYSDADKRKRKD